MGESLITQCTWLEAEIEETRQELREVASAGDFDGVTRVASRLGDQIKTLARLREKASALVYRNLAKEVAAQLLRMAKKTGPPSAHAITAIEPPQENEEADHAVGPFN